MTTEPQPQTASPAAANSTIKVFGVGHAGQRVIEETLALDLQGASLVAVNSDTRALAPSTVAEKVLCHRPPLALALEGLASTDTWEPAAPRTNPDAGQKTEDLFPRFKSMCQGSEVVLIVAGLGGRTGTAIAPTLARAARECGALTLAFVFLPFDCECNWRLATAQSGLSELRQIANLVMVMPNQNALKLIGSATSLPETYKAANRLLAESLRGACRALTGQTVMGLPFSDLCTLVRQRSTDCLFAVAEASGSNRAKDALERLLAHPMLEGPGVLPEAEAVAVCVLGDTNLPMVELNQIMKEVQGHCHGAPVMMGASLRPDALDTLTLGVLVARAEAAPTQPAAETSLPGQMNQSNGTKQTNRGPHGTAHEAVTDPAGIVLLNESAAKRAPSRFVAPAPELPQDKLEQMRARQGASRAGGRKPLPKLRQSQLPLEIISKGRFDNSEPTVHKGEDLDVPTYIRRGVTLN